jgi:hypothetical protein
MHTQTIAANMLIELLDSDEAIGPAVRVRLERTLHVLRGQAVEPERPEDRRSNEIKRRLRDGLRSATAEDLAELRGVGVSAAALRQAMEAV